LFVCDDQQVNNSLEELDLNRNQLTDEFTADDNFIHLGKLRKLDLSNGLFSVEGIAAISLMIQVRFPIIPSNLLSVCFVAESTAVAVLHMCWSNVEEDDDGLLLVVVEKPNYSEY